MQVNGLLKGEFGPHTRLIHNLSREIMDLQKTIQKFRTALGQSRQRVLLVVEPDGEVNAYASMRVDVEVIHVPRGEWTGKARTTVEKWIDAAVSKEARKIHQPGRWAAVADYRTCPTVSQLLDRKGDQMTYEALCELPKVPTGHESSRTKG